MYWISYWTLTDSSSIRLANISSKASTNLVKSAVSPLNTWISGGPTRCKSESVRTDTRFCGRVGSFCLLLGPKLPPPSGKYWFVWTGSLRLTGLNDLALARSADGPNYGIGSSPGSSLPKTYSFSIFSPALPPPDQVGRH